MTFTEYLTRQLTDFIEVYKKYFKKTYSTCLVLAVVCLIVIAILLRFSSFDPRIAKKQVGSLLNYFSARYSAGDTYSLVDLSKTVFIFFTALFSIALTRFELDEEKGKETTTIIKKIGFEDILFCTLTLLVCSAIDYGLAMLHNSFETTLQPLGYWVLMIIFLLRIYTPLILFSLLIYRQRIARPIAKIGLKKILFLFVSLWLFNEFAYEFGTFIRTVIINLVVIPFGDNNTFIQESILTIPLFAFWFLGYHSAMNSSLKLLDEQDTSISNSQ